MESGDGDRAELNRTSVEKKDETSCWTSVEILKRMGKYGIAGLPLLRLYVAGWMRCVQPFWAANCDYESVCQEAVLSNELA